MNNAILFYFDINISNVRKINNNYYLKYMNDNYGIYLYNRDIEDSMFLYYLNVELLNEGLKGYQIVLNKFGSALFNYEDKNYILMKFPNIENRPITYKDIMNFDFQIDNNRYKKLDKSNWSTSWSNKIDFTIYQFSQMEKKYKVISECMDYFIGIWENAISYFNNNISNHKKVVCHKRVDINMNLFDFLNPLNFVIDYKERDIGEYLKSYVINKNFSLNSFDKLFSSFSREGVIILIDRILFPSYFFDIYERVVVDKENESEIISVINRSKNVLKLLKYMFNKFSVYNIPYIEWIKKSD